MKDIAKKVAKEHIAKKLKVLYAAVFLYDNEQRKLLEWWEREVGPLLSKKYGHHMTLAYRPDVEFISSLTLGKEVELEVIGYGADEKGQAVKVLAPVSTNNDIPHVTIATDGTPPSHSNKVLASSLTTIKGPKIRGKIGYFNGKEIKYSL